MSDSKLSRRLMSRQDGGVYRRQMDDGGSVVTGPIVSRALRAVGARAMTWDHEIFVDENFRSNDPEDASLYAHERHHQSHSGGADVGVGHTSSSEEMGAQAIERMVLHRAAEGESVGDIMRDPVMRRGGADMASGSGSPGRRSVPDGGAQGEGMSGAEEAMLKLMAQGIPYDVIVRDLTTYCVRQIHQTRESATLRRSKHDYF